MNLQGWRYHVVGGDSAIEQMMDNACAFKSNLKGADIVVFSGGTDISCTMYGDHVMHQRTQFPDRERDRIETEIYNLCVSKKKTIVGICRGAQLVNVLNDGKLYQHVDKHVNCHHHVDYTDERGHKFKVLTTSDHHQMMIPTEDSRIIGVAHNSTIKATGSADFVVTDADDFDPEIVWYPKTKSLCYQPHPEWGLVSDRNLFLDCVRRVMIG